MNMTVILFLFLTSVMHAAGPATVDHPPSEDKLPRVTLTPKAWERLGVRTVPAEKRSLQPRRLYPGMVMPAPGARALVVAPFVGRISLPEGAARPQVGYAVSQGQVLARLEALIPPERFVLTPAEHLRIQELEVNLAQNRADALAVVHQAEIEDEAGQQAQQRARSLFSQRAGSQRGVEEAEARAGTARARLVAAREKYQLLLKIQLKIPKITDAAPSIDIVAPRAGTLQDMPIADGQIVTLGTPLFEVLDSERPWLKVGLHPSELDQIDGKATVHAEGEVPGDAASRHPADAVKAPQAVISATASVDLYYQLRAPGSGLRPGQRTGVWIPLKEPSEMIVVPASALVKDMHGTSWLYIEHPEHIYERRGVEVLFTQGELAALAPGRLMPGTPVVVEGVAELFGTEFQFGK